MTTTTVTNNPKAPPLSFTVVEISEKVSHVHIRYEYSRLPRSIAFRTAFMKQDNCLTIYHDGNETRHTFQKNVIGMQNVIDKIETHSTHQADHVAILVKVYFI